MSIDDIRRLEERIKRIEQFLGISERRMYYDPELNRYMPIECMACKYLDRSRVVKTGMRMCRCLKIAVGFHEYCNLFSYIFSPEDPCRIASEAKKMEEIKKIYWRRGILIY